VRNTNLAVYEIRNVDVFQPSYCTGTRLCWSHELVDLDVVALGLESLRRSLSGAGRLAVASTSHPLPGELRCGGGRQRRFSAGGRHSWEYRIGSFTRFILRPANVPRNITGAEASLLVVRYAMLCIRFEYLHDWGIWAASSTF
jgi:hypothetical protein